MIALALVSVALLLQAPNPGPKVSPDPEAERGKAWFDEHTVYFKYRYGSAAFAEEALLAHAEKAVAKADAAHASDRAGAHLDAAFTYARLGILAEKCGRSGDSARYFKMATDHLLKRNEKVPEDLLRKAMAEIDSDWDKFLGVDPDGPQKGPRAEGCRPTTR